MVAEHIEAHLASLQLRASDIRCYWLHQANLSMNQLIARRLLGRDASLDEAPVILDRYANTSSAGSVIAWHLHQQDLPSGALGVLASFGAGYSVGVWCCASGEVVRFVGVRAARGPDLGRSSSRMPTDFLCFAKESQQKKATPGRAPSAACGDGGPFALLESQGPPRNGASAAPPLSRDGQPPDFSAMLSALYGEKTAMRHRLRTTYSLVYGSPRPTAQMKKCASPILAIEMTLHFSAMQHRHLTMPKNVFTLPPCPLTVATNRHALRCPSGGQGAQT